MSSHILTQSQQQLFQKDGYVVIPNFKSKDEIDTLNERAQHIVSLHDIERYKAVFKTGERHQENQEIFQQYFLDSANQISCFFEEKAFDINGELTQDMSQSINKIGHALHDLDPVFDLFSRGEKMSALAQALGLKQPQIWQSMYIFKHAKIGGKVDWHQDASFFQTTPSSVITFWFALDDANIENGCLWVERGGHKSPLRQIFTRQRNATHMQMVDKTPWPCLNSAEPLEVKAGTLVCFHGHLPHYSAQNISDHSRRAYTLHVTDGMCDYAPGNWIQRGEILPIRGF